MYQRIMLISRGRMPGSISSTPSSPFTTPLVIRYSPLVNTRMRKLTPHPLITNHQSLITNHQTSECPIIDRHAHHRLDLQALVRLDAQLGPIPGAVLDAVYPFAEPGLRRFLARADPVPFQVERVVAVVVALSIRRVSGERNLAYRAHAEIGNQRAVRIRTNHRLVHDFLDRQDHSL